MYIYFIKNVILFVFLIIIYKKDLLKDLINFDIKKNISKILLYWSLISIFNYIFLFLFKNISINQSSLINIRESNIILFILLSSFTAPIIEEIIFRLILKKYIKKEIAFIIISLLLFGFMHIIPINNIYNLIFIINYGFMGFILAYSYIKEKNICIPICIHILNNLIINILFLLEV